MKKDIVDDILSVEEEAKKVVADANTLAHDMVFNAQAEAIKLVDKKVDDARRENNDTLAQLEALNEKELNTYKEAKELQLNKPSSCSDDNLQQAANKIVDTICKVTY